MRFVSTQHKAIEAEASACTTLRANGTASASGYPMAGGPASKVLTSFEGAHHFLKVSILENPEDSFEGAHPLARCAPKSEHLRILEGVREFCAENGELAAFCTQSKIENPKSQKMATSCFFVTPDAAFGTTESRRTSARQTEEFSMGRLPQTQFHKVFLADQEGNTLVVAPRGDAVGFRDSDVAGELKTLCDLAGSPGILNLVVDLGSSDYFGSTMIGAINQMGNSFRYIGGRIALCDVSPQMDDMLEIMHLKDVWMIFDTRKIALRAMGKTA